MSRRLGSKKRNTRCLCLGEQEAENKRTKDGNMPRRWGRATPGDPISEKGSVDEVPERRWMTSDQERQDSMENVFHTN